MDAVQVATRVGGGTLKPPIPENVDSPIREILKSCFASPDERPSFSYICAQLEKSPTEFLSHPVTEFMNYLTFVRMPLKLSFHQKVVPETWTTTNWCT